MKWYVGPKVKQNPYDWHFSFAWKPVRINNHKYWLQTMYRRAERINEHGHIVWEYMDLDGY